MARKKRFSINPEDLAAAKALSALHPEYEDEDYLEDDAPFTPEEIAAMRRARGEDDV